MKMNQEVKALWLEALRSGEYQQGRGELRASMNSNHFCCLGVLCDLHRKVTGKGDWYDRKGFIGYRTEGHTESARLPGPVVRWSGVQSAGNVKDLSYQGGCLIKENDSGKTFAEIADIIEQYL